MQYIFQNKVKFSKICLFAYINKKDKHEKSNKQQCPNFN